MEYHAASNHGEMQSSGVQSSIRGTGIFAAWVVLPGAFGVLAARLGASILAVGLLLPWTALIFPHGSTWIRADGGGRPAWSLSVAIILATIQWSAAALLFGWKTRMDPDRERAWVAPVVVIAVALAVRVGLHLSGITVDMDGP